MNEQLDLLSMLFTASGNPVSNIKGVDTGVWHGCLHFNEYRRQMGWELISALQKDAHLPCRYYSYKEVYGDDEVDHEKLRHNRSLDRVLSPLVEPICKWGAEYLPAREHTMREATPLWIDAFERFRWRKHPEYLRMERHDKILRDLTSIKPQWKKMFSFEEEDEAC